MRDIQMILERWGVWSRHRYETDYSPIAAGFKGLLPETANASSCSDSDAMIVDSCVGRLKQKRPEEYNLIKEHYIKDIPKRQIAKKLRCDEKNIRIKLQLAEGFIEGCLSMIDVKLDMEE